jgi:Meiotically Up-regulated Gene 113 (MUG113) protein
MKRPGRPPLDASESTEHHCNQLPSTVYLVKSGDLYKIGIADSVPQRLQALRHMSAIRVKHIAHANVCCKSMARELEHRLHTKYKYRRRHGEWFNLDHIEVWSVARFLKSPWINIRRHRRARVNNARRDCNTRRSAELACRPAWHHDRFGLVLDPCVEPIDPGENFATSTDSSGTQSASVNFADQEPPPALHVRSGFFGRQPWRVSHGGLTIP